jgi:hypothetical protein
MLSVFEHCLHGDSEAPVHLQEVVVESGKCSKSYTQALKMSRVTCVCHTLLNHFLLLTHFTLTGVQRLLNHPVFQREMDTLRIDLC